MLLTPPEPSSSVHASFQALGEECPFVAKAPATSELNYRQVDLGVLQLCGNAGHICVQDESSSIGGRCVLETRPAEETVSHHSEVGEVERILPTCEKCNGTRACLYADQSKIGCGSCIGDYTCYGFSGESISLKRNMSDEIILSIHFHLPCLCVCHAGGSIGENSW